MFNKRIKVKELLQIDAKGQEVTVMGWVRTFRNNQFIALNDGSTNQNIQIVAELGLLNEDSLKRITTGASLKICGKVVPSLGKGQIVEVKAITIEVLGSNPEFGSSQNKYCGLLAIALAKAARFFIPPDNSPGYKLLRLVN